MRAAVTLAPGSIELQEVEEPIPGPGDAVVAVRSVGLCGSDIHFFGGHHPYARYPQIQGHEVSGLVESLPVGYAGSCQPGDLVVMEPLRSCGHCFPCRRGRTNCCVHLQVLGVHSAGGLAERMVVPATCLYRAQGISVDLAALVEPTSIGLEANTRAGTSAGDQVLVFGAGPIGLTSSVAALDRGADVLVVDQLSNRLSIASALGVRRVVDTQTDDLAAQVEEWTGAEGPAVVIETTGVPALLRQGTELVAPSGTVVVVGLSEQEVNLPVIDFSRKELNVIGSRNSAGIFDEAVRLVARRMESLAQLVTHRFSFDQAPEAMRFVSENREIATKVLVTSGGEGA